MTNQPKVLILGGNSNLKLFVFLFPLIQSIKICGFCFHSISQVGLNILFNKQLIATKMICVNLKKGRKTKRMSIIIKLHLIAVECVYALIPSHNIYVFFSSIIMNINAEKLVPEMVIVSIILVPFSFYSFNHSDARIYLLSGEFSFIICFITYSILINFMFNLDLYAL